LASSTAVDPARIPHSDVPEMLRSQVVRRGRTSVIGEGRQRRRYRAEMPQAAWKNGREPQPRGRRRDAFADLADGLARYRTSTPPEESYTWASWGLRLGAGLLPGAAPDGSTWFVRTCIEYV
jgi:hypothetical protein